MTLPNSAIAADRIILGFGCVLAILALAVGGDATLSYVAGAASVAVVSVLIPRLRKRSDKLPIRLLYIIYILPALYLLYPIAITLGHHLQPRDYDSTLIAIDRFMFGGADPTRWIFQHINLAPLSVELFQICYYAHYLYPLFLGTELYLRAIDGEIESYRILMVYGAILSFVVNMIVPAIGPRFTLYEFADLSKELPGLWLTGPIRSMINSAEGVRETMTSGDASMLVFRDAFPSGHTMLTLLTLWAAFHYRARVRWLLLPLGTGLIVSTILLRYHYVTDVLAGIVFAAIVIWSAPSVARLLGNPGLHSDGSRGDGFPCPRE